jgi:hypothetical protein
MKSGDIAVGGIPLGRHGPALGHGDVLGGRAQRRHLAVGESVIAQLESADQGAVHDQVGIAADGRSEVGVFCQFKPKWPILAGS